MKKKELSSKLLLLATVLLVLGTFLAAVQLFQNASVLGGWFWPAVFGLMAVLITALAWFRQRQELRWLRTQLGDQLFFEKFPRERAREEKRLGYPLELEEPTQEERISRHQVLVDLYVQEAKEKQKL